MLSKRSKLYTAHASTTGLCRGPPQASLEFRGGDDALVEGGPAGIHQHGVLRVVWPNLGSRRRFRSNGTGYVIIKESGLGAV